MIQTILITIIIVTLPFWFIVLHKCVVKEHRTKRFLWLLLIIFTYTIGTIIYYLVKRRYFRKTYKKVKSKKKIIKRRKRR